MYHSVHLLYTESLLCFGSQPELYHLANSLILLTHCISRLRLQSVQSLLGFILQVCVPGGTKDNRHLTSGDVSWLHYASHTEHTLSGENLCQKWTSSSPFLLQCRCSPTLTWPWHAGRCLHLQGISQIHVIICQPEQQTQSILHRRSVKPAV